MTERGIPPVRAGASREAQADEARVAARLDELGARYALPPEAPGRLRRLLETLASDPGAPSTVRSPVEAVDVHLADSLSGLEVDAVAHATTIADLGTGAGFPGLVLACALPGAEVHLVESVGRKAAFVKRAATAADIRNAAVIAERAEEWEAGLEAADVVTARALAPIDVVVEYAAPLLRLGGTLVAWTGRREEREEHAGARAAEVVGLEPGDVRRVQPFPGARAHHLTLYLKVRSTPNRFPRRAGMARKRPLGGRR